MEQFLARNFTIPGNSTISHLYTHLKKRLGNIDSNYFDRVHVVLSQVERSQPKYETDRAGWGRPSHHYSHADIKGYYANINHHTLYEQLCNWVTHTTLRRLLWQFLHYTVEQGGIFHTQRKGIARSSSLSPLLRACHLTFLDSLLAIIPGIHYVRYMDDFLIFTRINWHLRRVVTRLNIELAKLSFRLHQTKPLLAQSVEGLTGWSIGLMKPKYNRLHPRLLVITYRYSNGL